MPIILGRERALKANMCRVSFPRSSPCFTPRVAPELEPSFSRLRRSTKVFKILDLDDDGTLDADEFLSGCLRLRGAAKALDVLATRLT